MSALSPITREEHLQWCKHRALEYVKNGDMEGAFNSFASDLGKEESTASARQLCAELGMPLLMAGHLSTPEQMRKFITGFN